jgi:hypothetical protein
VFGQDDIQSLSLLVPLAQWGVRPLLGRFLPPLALVAGLVSGGIFVALNRKSPDNLPRDHLGTEVAQLALRYATR